MVCLRSAVFLLWINVLFGCRTGESHYDDFSPESIQNQIREEIRNALNIVQYLNDYDLAIRIEVITQYGAKAVPELIAGLAHGSSRVRQTSVYILGKIIQQEVAKHFKGSKNDPSHGIIARFKELEDDPDYDVRIQAAVARLSLGDSDAASILIDGLNGKNLYSRLKCFNELNRATGLTFGYGAGDSETKRLKAIECWREWWFKIPTKKVELETYLPPNN